MKPTRLLCNSKTTDASRILAATVIYSFHVGLFAPFPLSNYCEYAVEFFVMLSGIAYVAFSSQKPSTFAEYRHYVIRRLTALFPIYVLVNLVVFGASYVYPSTLGRPFTLGEFLASVFGISMFLDWHFMTTVMWFMPFIMQVYLLLPLIDACAVRIHPVLLMLAAFGISVLLAQAVPLFFSDPVTVRLCCKNWSQLFRLPEVCAGIILGRMAVQRTEQVAGILGFFNVWPVLNRGQSSYRGFMELEDLSAVRRIRCASRAICCFVSSFPGGASGQWTTFAPDGVGLISIFPVANCSNERHQTSYQQSPVGLADVLRHMLGIGLVHDRP